MKNLIVITGSNGYLGRELVKLFIKKKYQVIGISRNKSTFYKHKNYFYFSNKKIIYNELLKEKIKGLINNENYKNKIFLNLAWSGEKSLSDGGLDIQLSNTILSTNFLDLAADLNFDRFINVGSILEKFFDQYLNLDWKNSNFSFNNQRNYILSKSINRDFCSLKAYLKKIDYVHCTFSVFIDEEITGKGYIHNVLRNISKGQSYVDPNNDQFYDLTNLKEGCESISKLCLLGNNKGNYYIGCSKPLILKDIFNIFKDQKNSKEIVRCIKKPNTNINKFFDNSDLFKDTGFKPETSFEDFAKKYFLK